mgnify:FL=1
MYDDNIDNPNRVMRFKLGRFGTDINNYQYGLRLYNSSGEETLITRDNGELWLKRELTVGDTTGLVGLSGLPASNQEESPIRIWAGSADKASAPFWVREDGTFTASKAYITGTIHATDGEFKGKIEAGSGTIGGWLIQKDSLSSGNMTLSSAKGDNPERINVNNKFIVTDDGTMKASAANITGTITAIGGKIGNMTIAQIEGMNGDVKNLKGDTSIITIEITSSSGNVSKKGQEFSTVLTAIGKHGNIPFTDEDYNNYTYKWESSTDSLTWTVIQGATTRIYTYSATLTDKLYLRCRFVEKS